MKLSQQVSISDYPSEFYRHKWNLIASSIYGTWLVMVICILIPPKVY
jgi:uncharacterized membrane protein